MKYYANWKLNKTQNEMKKYFKEFNSFAIADTDELCFFVSSCLLQSACKSTKFNIGTQNIAPAVWGAYTGETSIEQALECGVNFVLVGHSERRNLFFETDEVIASKLNLLQNYEITSVLCIGEKLEELKQKNEVLSNQIDKAFSKLDKMENIIIAYEPVWAIGSGLTPKTKEIEKTIKFIKKYIEKKYKVEIEVLYGGSVNKDNIAEFKKIKNLDGFLVGGASLNAQNFYELVNA